MSVSNFNELAHHIGHRTVVTYYGARTSPHNVAIECRRCNTVLLDFDSDDVEDSGLAYSEWKAQQEGIVSP